MNRTVAVLAVALGLCACTASENIEAADAAVTKFRSLLDEERFEAIWSQGTTEFQKAIAREEFVEFLAAVHRKLGNVDSATREGWNVNYTTGGPIVTLSYKTKFNAGEAVEQFVYRNDGKLAQLLRYDISSRLLIVK